MELSFLEKMCLEMMEAIVEPQDQSNLNGIPDPPTDDEFGAMQISQSRPTNFALFSDCRCHFDMSTRGCQCGRMCGTHFIGGI